MEQDPSRETDSRLLGEEHFRLLVEPEGLLMCFQQHTTGPYPEPSEVNPHPHKLFI
jgi:hypothetical protein